MQDIKKGGIKKHRASNAPSELPSDAKKLYEKHAKESHKRAFTGSKVSVTNVHVPKQSLSDELIMEKRPLFATVDKKPKKKKRASMRLGRKERLLAFSLLGVVLITAALAAFIFLPHAAISLTLQTAPLLVDQSLIVTSAPASVPNGIPGSVFVEQIQVQGSSPVTSTEIIGKKATGKVTLVNKTFDEQKIKEKSRLVTKDGVLFFMQGAATIPAASGSSVATTTVTVEAAEPGTDGNISPQRLDFAALDANGKALVYGEAANAFTGGSGDEVKVVQEADLTQAKADAGAQAKAQMEPRAKSKLEKGWLVLDESWDTQITAFEPGAKVGDKMDSIPYTASVGVRVMAYKEDALTTVLTQALTQKLDENYMLFPAPLSYTKTLESANWDKNEVTITARVTHTTIPSISLDTLKDKLAGRSKDDTQSYLQALPGVQRADVKVGPFWVQNIPKIQKRIDINIASDRES